MKTKIIAIAFISIFFCSCNKRQYTCECTIPGAAPSDFIITDTQKNASQKCATYTTPGPPPTTCAIK